jgi:hypothetical protein
MVSMTDPYSHVLGFLCTRNHNQIVSSYNKQRLQSLKVAYSAVALALTGVRYVLVHFPA